MLIATALLSLALTAPPPPPGDPRGIAPEAAFATTEAPPPPPPPLPPRALARPEAPEPLPAAPAKILPPRFTGVGLIFASAIAGGVVVAWSTHTAYTLATTECYFGFGECADNSSVTALLYGGGIMAVASLGTGLAAGAGWHRSRWRHWQGHRHDKEHYKRYAWSGVGLLTGGVAAQIVGTTLWGLYGDITDPCSADEGLDHRCSTAAFSLLATGALLRAIGIGLATYGWGGQRWLKHGSGRVPRRKRGRLFP